ncbi:MAG: sugar kinase [Endozoicomonas sp.]|uniref:sugar kinase n=1 Tax=Endozoicomonas sp. TaxID=1892382 RepID=UPI003D9B6C7D
MIQTIACIGECMEEQHATASFNDAFRCGGDVYNTAVYMKRSLNNGRKISFITALGHDPLSSTLLDEWKDEGVDCELVGYVKGKQPGQYRIHLSPDGERSFSYNREDSAARYMFTAGLEARQLAELQQGYDLYYLSGITLAILNHHSRRFLLDILQQAKSRGARIAFDSNYRASLWSSGAEARQCISEVLALTDIALLSLDDELELFGDRSLSEVLKRLEQIPEIVIKQGGSGCFVKTASIEKQLPAINAENVLDTTAAGDAFNGAYLAARINNEPIEDAIHCAQQMASIVVSYPGAIVPRHLSETSQYRSAARKT